MSLLRTAWTRLDSPDSFILLPSPVFSFSFFLRFVWIFGFFFWGGGGGFHRLVKCTIPEDDDYNNRSKTVFKVSCTCCATHKIHVHTQDMQQQGTAYICPAFHTCSTQLQHTKLMSTRRTCNNRAQPTSVQLPTPVALSYNTQNSCPHAGHATTGHSLHLSSFPHL